MIYKYLFLLIILLLTNCDECNCDDKINEVKNEYGEPCLEKTINHGTSGYIEKNLVYLPPNILSNSNKVKWFFYSGDNINSCCNYTVYECIYDTCNAVCDSITTDLLRVNSNIFDDKNCIFCP